PSIAVRVNIARKPTLAAFANQVNKPNRIARPIPISINTIIFCINKAISAVGIIISIIQANQPGILLRIGSAHSVAASEAALVGSCNQGKSILIVEDTNHESSPIPLNNNGKLPILEVAFCQISCPHSFDPPSIS